ncbi:MAG TPA: ABC transporter permease, partial [Terrimesophilobacter sp.]|nr:ABC transporter permease [Terrimesophilobacter sp.]
VFFLFSALPTWMQTVAAVFPLKWMAQGMRAVFLPDGLAVLEQGGVWNLEGVALWLSVWLVAGLVLSLVTFRWIRRDA